MGIDFSGYDQALTQAGIDPEQAGKLLNFARQGVRPAQSFDSVNGYRNANPAATWNSVFDPGPKAAPAGGNVGGNGINFGSARSAEGATPYLRTLDPRSMAGGSGINFGDAHPSDAIGARPSLQERYNAVQDPQAPAPAKFSWGRLMKAVGVGLLGGSSAGIEQYEKPNVQAQQAYQDAQSAADSQRKEIADEAGIERERAETEEAQARTEGLRNPKAVAVKPEPEKPITMETGQGPIQYNQRTGQWEKVTVGGQPVGPKESVQGDTNKLNPLVEAELGGAGARPDPKDYPGGIKDPKYQADIKKYGQQGEAISNRMTGARGDAYNKSRPVEVLDTWNGNRPIRVSAQEQEDNPGRYVNAGQGVKAVAGQTTADDIEGAINNLRATTSVLDSGSVNRTVLEAILNDPKTNTGNFLQTTAARQLTAEEQDYVVALLNAREVIPGLRNLLGTGTATDARVKNMLDTLPGARTAGSAMANKQLDAALGTLRRIRPAIPNVKAQGQPAGGGSNDPLGIR